MKPVVGPGLAWTCTVVSVFAILSLSVIGYLYQAGHEEFAGGRDDPDPEELPAVAGTIFTAVWVYIGFFFCCGLQGYLHVINNRRGAGGISI